MVGAATPAVVVARALPNAASAACAAVNVCRVYCQWHLLLLKVRKVSTPMRWIDSVCSRNGPCAFAVRLTTHDSTVLAEKPSVTPVYGFLTLTPPVLTSCYRVT